MKLEITSPELDRFAAALLMAPQVTRTEMLKAEEGLLAAGVRFTAIAAPVDQGNLRGSIGVLVAAHWTGGGVSGSYGTNLLYAAQRNFGGPIYAKPGGWLVFEVGGKTIFAKKVVQTGSHFMESGMDQVEPMVIVAFEGALDRVFAALGG